MSQFYTSKFYSHPIEVVNNNGEIMVIITDDLNRKSIYSWYNLKEKNSQSPYINKCLLGSFLQDSFKNILVIGAGGGSFIKYIEDHISNSIITGIEIDKTMIQIAQQELGIKTNNIILGDMSSVLNNLVTKGMIYDVVLFDVYGSNGEIPDDILNKKILSNIKKLLSNTGIFSINYSNFNIDSQDQNDQSRISYYRSIHQELKNLFPKNFIAFTSEDKQGENISGIYNLEKTYSLNEIKSNYFKKIKSNEIIYDAQIIESIYLDDEGIFLDV